MCKLEDQIKCLRAEIHNLRVKLSEKVLHLRELEEELHDADEPLAGGVIERYSRQLLLPGMEVRGQQRLMSTSFLIVGMGGLGCPAAQYLVAAGCGAVSLVDYDTVELNNLHRQILHTEKRVGWHKVDSAAYVLSKMNSKCKIKCYRTALDSKNALEIIRQHDVVLDCSDNVATRYLLNDACVLAGKPLVSGSALQWEGQLTVFNHKNGPCYRCIFPTPPPPETVNNCSDGGVLGAVTGTIGSLQALEAIKIAIDAPSVLSQRMLIFDGMETLIRNIKLRPRVPNCAVCSPHEATIKELIDYEQFCGAPAKEKKSRSQIAARLRSSHRERVLRHATLAAFAVGRAAAVGVPDLSVAGIRECAHRQGAEQQLPGRLNVGCLGQGTIHSCGVSPRQRFAKGRPASAHEASGSQHSRHHRRPARLAL